MRVATNAWQFAALLLALGLLAACSKDPKPCTVVDNGDGTSTIACEGGSLHFDGGEGGSDCTLVRAENGAGTITCKDGTVIHLDADGNPIFPGKGAVTGRATYFGLEEHQGIRVRAMGTAYETLTDATGQYTLEDLPSGLYTLIFEGRERVPVVRRNIPVVNGVYRLEAQLLVLGLEIGPAQAAQWVTESPTHETFFVHQPQTTSRLVLWDVESRQPTALSATAKAPSYSPDGSRIVYVEDRSADGRVIVWDVAARRGEELMHDAVDAVFTGDGRFLVIRKLKDLVLLELATGAITEVGEWSHFAPWLSPDGKLLIYLRSSDDVHRTLLWEIDGGHEHVLGQGFVDPASVLVTPDGKELLYLDINSGGQQGLRHWSVDEHGGAELLATGLAAPPVMAPDGGSALFQWTAGSVANLRLWVRREATPRALGEVSQAAYALGGAALVWSSSDSGGSSLVLYDIRASSVELLTNEAVLWQVAPDGQSVWIDPGGLGEGASLLHLESREETLLGRGRWKWSSDGKWLAFESEEDEERIRSLRVLRTSSSRPTTVVRDPQGWQFLPGERSLAFWTLNHETMQVSIGAWDLEASRATILGQLASGEVAASPSGQTAFFQSCFVGTCGILAQVDLEGRRMEPIAKDVEWFDPYERFLIYTLPPAGGAESGTSHLVTGVK